MAQELSRESAEEFDDLVAERDALQAELDTLRAELGTSTNELKTHVSRVAELETEIAGLRSDHAITRSTAEERAARIIELEGTVKSTMAHVAAAEALVAVHTSRITALEQELDLSSADTTDQSRLLIVGILSQRQRLSHATSAWRKASSLAQRHDTALAAANTQVETLRGQVDAFDAERSAMSEQFQSHTQRAKALDTAKEKVHELESQVEYLHGECDDIAAQLDTVLVREQSHAKQVQEASDTRAQLEEVTQRADTAGKELLKAQQDVTRLETEITSVNGAKSATDSAQDQVESELRQELEKVKSDLAASETRASESAEALKKLSAQMERLESWTTSDKDTAEGDSRASQDMSLVERTEVNINLTANTIDSLRQHMVAFESQLLEETTKSVELQAHSRKLVARLADVEARAVRDAGQKDADLQTMQEAVNAKNEEVRVMTERATSLQIQCEALRAQVDVLTTKLEEATESATDHTLELQTEKATLEKQLASTSEKADALRMEVSSTMSKNQRLTLEITTLSTELLTTKSSLVVTQSTVEEMKGDMERLEVEKEKTEGMLKYQQTETSSRYVLSLRDI
jgi:chromosome segregation ATPase